MSNLDEALSYAAAGFPVLPCHWSTEGVCSCGDRACKSVGKHPRTKKGSKDATTTEAQIRLWWSNWPDASVGIATGSKAGIFVVDIDRGEERDGFLWLGAVGDELPDTPKAVTPSGGVHLFFKYPSERSVKQSSDQLCRGVDVRSEGGYVVAAPSVGANGVAYAWEDDLREFDAPDAPAWLLDLIGASQERVRAPGAMRWRVNEMLDQNKRAEIEDALRYVDSDARDAWLRVGMAIHSEFANEDGFNLWSDWSSSSDKFDSTQQRYTWDRLDSYGGVGLSTIFYMAQSNGWRGTSAMTVASAGGGALGSDSPVSANGIAASGDGEIVEVWEPPEGIGPFPKHLLDDAGGVLAEMIRWTNETAIRPQPVLALAASMAALGTVFGRAYCSTSDLRTNVYAIGVATSGAGKEHARRCVKTLFARAGCGDLLGGEDFASGAGLIKAMEIRPVQLFLVDEIGHLLAKIAGAKASSWERDLVSVMLRLYSAANSTMRGRELAGVERTDLEQPHACIYGTSTPMIFDTLSSAEVAGGLLSRFLVFDVEGKRPPKQAPPPSFDPPERLRKCVEGIRDEVELAQSSQGGNLSGVATVQGAAPFLVKVPEEPSCADVWARVEALADEGVQGPAGELWARLEEQAIRLALLRALSRDAWVRVGTVSQSRRITREDAEWGAEVALWCCKRLAALVEEKVADSQHEAGIKRVLSVVRKEGKRGIARSDLTRACFRLGKRAREEAIDTLLESHLIVAEHSGRKVRFYAVRRTADAIAESLDREERTAANMAEAARIAAREGDEQGGC